MKYYSDSLEKSLTAVFGGIGIIAIVIKLYISGFTNDNLLDAVKDIAGLVVVIAVFLVASKIFRRDKFDFNASFELYMKEWINQNRHLVCDNFEGDGKGKYAKRFCSMMIDHANIVEPRKLASSARPNHEKGAFVYLPYISEEGKMKEEFEFRFNERTFERQEKFRLENGKPDLIGIINRFASNINDTFSTLGIKAKATGSQKLIIVDFSEMKKSDANARALIDIVEYVKTMVLALA